MLCLFYLSPLQTREMQLSLEKKRGELVCVPFSRCPLIIQNYSVTSGENHYNFFVFILVITREAIQGFEHCTPWQAEVLLKCRSQSLHEHVLQPPQLTIRRTCGRNIEKSKKNRLHVHVQQRGYRPQRANTFDEHNEDPRAKYNLFGFAVGPHKSINWNGGFFFFTFLSKTWKCEDDFRLNLHP